MTGIFDIKELNIRGQFCLLSFKYYSEKNNELNIDEILQHVLPNGKVHFFRFYDLLYYSCLAHSELENVTFTFTYSRFIQACSEIGAGENSELLSKLFEARLLAQSLTDFFAKGATKQPATKKK